MKIDRSGASALAAALALALLPGGARAANVGSADIKPADGTSGQALTTGSGVKTGHIQDGAVTDAKIAGVSAAKVTGTLPAAQVEAGVFQKRYAQVVVVAKSGGDFADPIAAVAAIADASASKPYLVKIMPGVYDLGGRVLRTKSFVDLEGSGEGVTVLRGSGSEGAWNRSVVLTAGYGELRSLTIEGVGVPDPTVGQDQLMVVTNMEGWTIHPGAANLKHVTVVANGNGVANVAAVVYTLRSEVVLTDVTIRVSGANYSTGVSAGTDTWDRPAGETAAILMRGLDVRVSGGQATEGLGFGGVATADLRDSTVRATGATGINVGFLSNTKTARIAGTRIETDGAGGQAIHAIADMAPIPLALYVENSSVSSTNGAYGTLRNTGTRVFAAHTKVVGPIMSAPSTTTCIGVYDENFQPITCP